MLEFTRISPLSTPSAEREGLVALDGSWNHHAVTAVSRSSVPCPHQWLWVCFVACMLFLGTHTDPMQALLLLLEVMEPKPCLRSVFLTPCVACVGMERSMRWDCFALIALLASFAVAFFQISVPDSYIGGVVGRVCCLTHLWLHIVCLC